MTAYVSSLTVGEKTLRVLWYDQTAKAFVEHEYSRAATGANWPPVLGGAFPEIVLPGSLSVPAPPSQGKLMPVWLTAKGPRGTWVAIGSLQVACSKAGVVRMFIKSARGEITINLTSSYAWNGHLDSKGVKISENIEWATGAGDWSFEGAGAKQDTFVSDLTNNRHYFIRMVSTADYTDQRFYAYEI